MPSLFPRVSDGPGCSERQARGVKQRFTLAGKWPRADPGPFQNLRPAPNPSCQVHVLTNAYGALEDKRQLHKYTQISIWVTVLLLVSWTPLDQDFQYSFNSSYWVHRLVFLPISKFDVGSRARNKIIKALAHQEFSCGKSRGCVLLSSGLAVAVTLRVALLFPLLTLRSSHAVCHVRQGSFPPRDGVRRDLPPLLLIGFTTWLALVNAMCA